MLHRSLQTTWFWTYDDYDYIQLTISSMGWFQCVGRTSCCRTRNKEQSRNTTSVNRL